MTNKKFSAFGAVAFIAAALFASVAFGQGGPGGGPGPQPSPWVVSGNTISYSQGGVVLPANVTGGSKGVGTINAQGYYLNGAALTSGGSFAATAPLSVTFPAGVVTYACTTCAVTTNPLSQFASTTSAQLAGVISNETGTGVLVFNSAPTIISPVITTSFTATGLVGLPNLATQLANTILVNPTNAPASPIAQAVPSCSGAANALQWLTNTGIQCGTITASASSITVGTTGIVGGTTNGLLYNATGGLLGNLATANNGVLVTSGAGVLSISSTLPSALTIPSPTFSGTVAGAGTIPNTVLVNSSTTINGTAIALGASGTVTAAAGTLTGTTLNATVVTSSLTSVGTLTGGATGAGFTVALGTSTITGILTGTNGGTGVNNASRTITVGGNFSSSSTVSITGAFSTAGAFTQAGAFATTITTTATTNSTLPAGTHTLAGLDVAQTWSALQGFNDNNFGLNGATSGNLILRAAATSGASVIRFPAGSTDFSATGGANQFVKQSSAGAALTVAAIASADLPIATTGAIGGVRPDGTTITISGGIITASGASATAITVGTTNVVSGIDGNFLANNAGVLSNVAIRSYLAGLTLTTAGSSASFGIAVGTAADTANAAMITLGSAYTKTNAAWAVGSASGSLDTSTIAVSTWYKVFLMKRPDTGVVDICITLTANSACTTGGAIPAAYTLFRRIGYMRTDASGNWLAFSQLGDEFLWVVGSSVNDVNTAVLGTTPQLFTLRVPTGSKVIARLRMVTVSSGVVITSPDEGAQVYNSPTGNQTTNVGSASFNVTLDVRTNASAQIQAVAAGASSTLIGLAYGWFDRRGRDD
jgi:hypothetical protein